MDNHYKMRTEKLLIALNSEIEKKCLLQKEKYNVLRMKRLFITSCLCTILLFFFGYFYFNNLTSFICIFFIYQAIALVVGILIIFNFNRKVV
jgi:hypothetical protein